MITRRTAMLHLAGATCLLVCPAHAATTDQSRLSAGLKQIEAASGGRLGVAIHDLNTGLRADHRGAERFPLCSTFKLLAAGAILTGVDRRQFSQSQRVQFDARDVVDNSPITQHQTGAPGMTLEALCQAALNYSDNTAGNMLLKTIGGPAGLTRYARSLGDPVTRLDRWETALNEAVPGDPRDTTTPVAMCTDLERLLIGDALSSTSRDLLQTWLLNCKTSDARLKAGLPAGWRVGDKTGSGERGSTNDIGLIWPPGRKPIIIAVYLTNTDAAPGHRNATIASIGRLVADVFN
jgi:beta-lactamase class A